MHTLKHAPFIKFYAFCAIALLALSCGDKTNDNFDNEKALEDAKRIVSFLADDSLEGRATGSTGAQSAANFIAKEFQSLGLEPKGDDGFFQNFTRTPKSNPHVAETEGKNQLAMTTVQQIDARNVVGFLDNGAAQTVVIGAHFDHLGYGGASSLFRGDSTQVHNGADDNASGVAAMILAARYIKTEMLRTNNYVFVAFTGEEDGLWGSNYFSKNLPAGLDSINCMFNFDMVGRLREDRSLSVNGIGTSPNWKNMLDTCNSFNFKMLFTESGVGPSDHTSFYNQGIPVIHFFTGQHEDYHKPTDDIEKVNFEGIVDIAELTFSLAQQLETAGKLEFTETVQENSEATDFKVTMGVVPDYLYNERGLRIDGVSEGRPAALAGIQNGDIVLRMDTLVVNDIYDYMKGLSIFEPGDEVAIRILREDQEMLMLVEFD